MAPRHFKCSQFRKGILDFNFECIRLLQNDFCKQRYITLNATISSQDRIYPKTHLCRTFLAEYILEPTYERANIKINTKLHCFALNFLIPYVILWDFLCQNRFSCLIRLIRVYFAKKCWGSNFPRPRSPIWAPVFNYLTFNPSSGKRVTQHKIVVLPNFKILVSI